MLKKLSKQFQLLRELIFIQNIEKSHESKPFVDFSYDAFKQNAILISRHKEVITIIFSDELVRQVASPLTTRYDGKTHESIPFVGFT